MAIDRITKNMRIPVINLISIPNILEEFLTAFPERCITILTIEIITARLNITMKPTRKGSYSLMGLQILTSEITIFVGSGMVMFISS